MPSNLKAILAAVGLALAAAPAAAQSIAVETLPELDAWAVSGIRSGVAPIGASPWANSTAIDLAAAFDKVPSQPLSTAAARLAARALLTPGAGPQGDAGEAARKRYEAIARSGLAEPLSIMTNGGAATRDPAIQQYGVQANLSLGRLEAACAQARGVSAVPPSPFLLRTRAACFASEKDWPAAELALDVARSNRADDPWLVSALPHLAGVGAGAKPQAKYDTSLNTAVSLALKLDPPAGAFARASALAALAMATSPNAPRSLRPLAASRALTQGLISPEDARAAIRAALPPANARGAPPRLGPLSTGVRAVEAATSDAAKQRAIATVLAEASAPAQFAYSARVFEPEIRSLPPTSAGALDFARAALVLNDPDLARAWRSAAEGAAADRLAALDLAIAFASKDDRAATIAAGRLAAAIAPDRLPVAARLAAPLFGRGVSQASGAERLATGVGPGKALAEDLKAAIASAQARKAAGETALLVASALGPGVETISGGDVDFALDALEAVGLAEEAHALALEGLVAGLRL